MSNQTQNQNLPAPTSKVDLAKAVNWEGFGTNVQTYRDGDSLYVRIPDVKRKGEPSSTGKTVNIASTGGNQSIGVGDIKLGLNMFSKSMAQG